jgi:hypothetical protein
VKLLCGSSRISGPRPAVRARVIGCIRESTDGSSRYSPPQTQFTVVVNPYLCNVRRAHRNGPMKCRERHRLLAEYDAAALRLSHAEGHLAKRVSDEASRSCGETMAALQTHLLLHGCGQAHERACLTPHDARIPSVGLVTTRKSASRAIS